MKYLSKKQNYPKNRFSRDYCQSEKIRGRGYQKRTAQNRVFAMALAGRRLKIHPLAAAHSRSDCNKRATSEPSDAYYTARMVRCLPDHTWWSWHPSVLSEYFSDKQSEGGRHVRSPLCGFLTILIWGMDIDALEPEPGCPI